MGKIGFGSKTDKQVFGLKKNQSTDMSKITSKIVVNEVHHDHFNIREVNKDKRLRQFVRALRKEMVKQDEDLFKLILEHIVASKDLQIEQEALQKSISLLITEQESKLQNLSRMNLELLEKQIQAEVQFAHLKSMINELKEVVEKKPKTLIEKIKYLFSF